MQHILVLIMTAFCTLYCANLIATNYKCVSILLPISITYVKADQLSKYAVIQTYVHMDIQYTQLHGLLQNTVSLYKDV